ncbi:MAG: hypothetical protein HZA54_09565 [Planctomycetes bacterium]|nr:hypothetical protein [Planctomycetota bacterium]
MGTVGPGTAGNVLAAFASLCVPGLGQLLQGRVVAAIFFFCLEGAAWLLKIFTLGLFFFAPALTRLIAAIDAAVWKPD